MAEVIILLWMTQISAGKAVVNIVILIDEHGCKNTLFTNNCSLSNGEVDKMILMW